jgi:hypothetical protein
MHFFGTDVARDDDPMIHWGVKTRTNEQSRQEWIAQYVPKLWDMGIETPDPALAYDPGRQAVDLHRAGLGPPARDHQGRPDPDDRDPPVLAPTAAPPPRLGPPDRARGDAVPAAA